MIKVLHYIPAFTHGGIESLMINMISNLDDDNYRFDFLVETEVPDEYKRIIKKHGGKIIKTHKMTDVSTFGKYVHELKNVFKNGDYDVFHSHSLETRPFPMILAKRYSVKKRIMHIHFNSFNDNRHTAIKKLFIKIGERNANTYIACSKRAAESIYSKKLKNKVIVLNNGIDVNKYTYNASNRVKIKKELGLDNKTIAGCIGRLSYLKNQQFILQIAKELSNDYKFVFLGDGNEKENLQKYVNNNNIKNVIFRGNVDNVKEYLDAFDILLMPSMSEAMPLTILEAQANGIPAITSLAVDQEFIINSNVKRLRLSKEKWINGIKKAPSRVKVDSSLYQFDISSTIKQYKDILKEVVE